MIEVSTRRTRLLSLSGSLRDGELKRKLAPLDLESASWEEVTATCGKSAWLLNGGYCHACSNPVDDYVTVGEDHDYESCTARLCIDCVRAAYELLQQAISDSNTKRGV